MKFLALLLLCLAVPLQAATTVTVTLTWTNPGTSLVTVYRASGACPAAGVPTTGTSLTAAAPAIGPYTDSSITPTTAAQTFCYWAYPTGNPTLAVSWTANVPSASLSGFKGTVVVVSQ